MMWQIALLLGPALLTAGDLLSHRAQFDPIRGQEFWLAELRIHRDELVETGPSSYVVFGHVVGDNDSAVVLSAHEGALAGTLRTAVGQYRVSGGLVRKVQAETGVPERMPLVAEVGLVEPRSRTDSGDVLDLLVVYTPRARGSAGGRAAIEALVQLGVAETNLALRQSLVPTRVRLVEMREVRYEEAGRVESDLEILADARDGALDEVHELRDAHGADFVQLLVEEADGCGIAYLMREDSPGFSAWAFSVVEWSCIDTSYALTHELAHNLGCDHAPDDPATLGGTFEYSYGYRDEATQYRTIMAYGPGKRLARFSSPRPSVSGLTLGSSRQDNARTIARLRTTLANFRPGIAPPQISPDPDAHLSTDEVVFRFRSESRVVEWWLLAGSGPGKRDFFDSGSLGNLPTARVQGLPKDGGPVYIRLFYRRANVWLYEDYRYETAP